MKPLAITLGDPAGIGAEIVFKAIEQCDPALPIWIFGDWALASQSPGASLLQTLADGAENGSRMFVDVGSGDGSPVRWGTIDAVYGRTSLASINAAVSAIERGFCSALVTAPIHKQSVAAAGGQFPGHTELLAARAGLARYAHDYAMYFDSPTLRVALLSVHLPLRDAIAAIEPQAITGLARLVAREYQRLYGKSPRMAAAAINPHAGEGGMFGDEEAIIRRGVDAAAAVGLDITGPHPADTVFHAARQGRFDVVLSMYHDQGLIAVKTTDFDHSVNVTLGLPYLRCSVDHGTAFDIAGKGVADWGPMLHALRWAAAHAETMERR